MDEPPFVGDFADCDQAATGERAFRREDGHERFDGKGYADGHIRELARIEAHDSDVQRPGCDRLGHLGGRLVGDLEVDPGVTRVVLPQFLDDVDRRRRSVDQAEPQRPATQAREVVHLHAAHALGYRRRQAGRRLCAAAFRRR